MKQDSAGDRLVIHPRVSIIILNWNGSPNTIECLESVYRMDYPNYDTIVVDNGSADSSLETIRRYCAGSISIDLDFLQIRDENNPIAVLEYKRPEAETVREEDKHIANLPNSQKLILIKNERNCGFPAGNNVGIAYALRVLKPSYVLLLNNDTVVQRSLLSELVEIVERQDVGVITPTVCLYDTPMRMQEEARYRGITRLTEDTFLSGCCFLVATKVFESIGLLDPDYFLYCEDSDFFMRAKNAGFKVAYYPTQSCIFHKQGKSANNISGKKMYYMARSKVMFKKKYPAEVCTYTYVIRDLGIYLAVALVKSKFDPRIVYYFLKGLIDGASH